MRTLAALLIASCLGFTACTAANAPAPLTFSASALGAEAQVVRTQLRRFEAQHPGVRVDLRVTPDAADQRHQLYVQWLNAHADDPDVLQLDIIWTPEFAAAGWIEALDSYAPDVEDFFPATIAANRWRGALYAIPWFVDAGLLYRRTDLVKAPPRSLDDVRVAARTSVESGATRFGLVWQGARYEGLVTVFVEHLGAFGGAILDGRGRVTVDEPPAVRALTFMRDAVGAGGFVPSSTLTWQEEQVRFAFQNGESAFMRNWPYAWALIQDPNRSRVANHVAVGPFPAAEGGRPSAALGGGQLAVNAFSDEPRLAWQLVAFLTASDQMLERARVAAQLPARRSLYDTGVLADALTLPVDQLREALESATARPATPVYSELSEILQVRLHRALTGQEEPSAALHAAASEIRALLTRAGLSEAESR
jgi:ABC-type glycerol-3-phosphate transport system substrate-binding protein